MFQGSGVTAALAAGGALLAVMIAISWYGAATLPPTARIPLHWGGVYGTYVPKRVGLIAWPAMGALIYGLIGGLAGPAWSHGNQANWKATVFMIAIMGLLAAVQAGAIAAARRTAARQTVGDGAVGPEPR